MKMGDLRQLVITRDRQCMIAFINRVHVCADRWGDAHEPDELDKLTLGHVKEHPGGQRRDEPGWCIAQCARSNELHEETTREHRGLVLAYLAGVRAQAALLAATQAETFYATGGNG